MISIVSCFYNQISYLKTALEGYKNQTNKNFELIIVRDGGNEDPRDIVSGLDFVKVVDLPGGDDTFKLSAARNLGVKTATTDYIVFTDSDCVPNEDFVELHSKNRKEKTILVGFRNHCQQEFDYSKVKLTKFADDIRLNYHELDGSINPHLVFGCNFSLEKSGIIKINGFDEDYQCWGAEEKDLVYRLKNIGYDWKILRDCFVNHIEHPSRAGMGGENIWLKKIINFTVTRNEGRLWQGEWKNDS